MPQRGAYGVGLHTGCMVDVDPERFEAMVSEALDGIPAELGELMNNVAVTVQHDGGPAGLLGLYQGVPLTRRSTFYAGALPDRITIYSLGWERALVTGVEVPAGWPRARDRRPRRVGAALPAPPTAGYRRTPPRLVPRHRPRRRHVGATGLGWGGRRGRCRPPHGCRLPHDRGPRDPQSGRPRRRCSPAGILTPPTG